LKLVIFRIVKSDEQQHITDAQLLQRYATDGNNQWLGMLLQRYTLLLFGLCMKYLKDEEEAKDAVQQIFLKVLNEVGKYKIDYFKSWLYMVAKNHCLMRLRGAQATAKKRLTDGFEIAAPEENDVNFLQNEKTFNLLEEAMTELNSEQEQCINLFYLQKKSYQQISQQTGFSLLQVKSFIQNGKRNLKQALERKIKRDAAKK